MKEIKCIYVKNTPLARSVADSKWKTKQCLMKMKVGVPELLGETER